MCPERTPVRPDLNIGFEPEFTSVPAAALARPALRPPSVGHVSPRGKRVVSGLGPSRLTASAVPINAAPASTARGHPPVESPRSRRRAVSLEASDHCDAAGTESGTSGGLIWKATNLSGA
jgi:hypothetical protein